MSHHIYHTRGFILRIANSGEADRTIYVFTEHLGLLSVRARAARKTSSKLRYSLQQYSLVRIALVRGKNIWRLTDAEELGFFSAIGNAAKLKLTAAMLSLADRLVHGEGENAALFWSIEDIFNFLTQESPSTEEMFLTETLAGCRILSALGYVGENRTLSLFLNMPISKPLLENFASCRQEAQMEINRALRESQL